MYDLIYLYFPQEENAPKSSKLGAFFFGSQQKGQEGSFNFSIPGLFSCLLCPHPKASDSEVHLAQVAHQLTEVNSKIRDLEL